VAILPGHEMSIDVVLAAKDQLNFKAEAKTFPLSLLFCIQAQKWLHRHSH